MLDIKDPFGGRIRIGFPGSKEPEKAEEHHHHHHDHCGPRRSHRGGQARKLRRMLARMLQARENCAHRCHPPCCEGPRGGFRLSLNFSAQGRDLFC